MIETGLKHKLLHFSLDADEWTSILGAIHGNLLTQMHRRWRHIFWLHNSPTDVRKDVNFMSVVPSWAVLCSNKNRKLIEAMSPGFQFQEKFLSKVVLWPNDKSFIKYLLEENLVHSGLLRTLFTINTNEKDVTHTHTHQSPFHSHRHRLREENLKLVKKIKFS